jgi:hypothetical protein
VWWINAESVVCWTTVEITRHGIRLRCTELRVRPSNTKSDGRPVTSSFGTRFECWSKCCVGFLSACRQMPWQFHCLISHPLLSIVYSYCTAPHSTLYILRSWYRDVKQPDEHVNNLSLHWIYLSFRCSYVGDRLGLLWRSSTLPCFILKYWQRWVRGLYSAWGRH